MLRNRLMRSLTRAVVALLALAAAAAASPVRAGDAPSAGGGVDGARWFGHPAPAVWGTGPRPAVRALAPAAVVPQRRTIPSFTGTFTSGGQSYAYEMAGADPRRSQSQTVIPVVIVPIRFVFAGGARFDPGRTTAQLRRSPLFQRATFGSDATQYGDAFRRAEFWSDVASTGYHVLLGHQTVTPTVVVHVSAANGSVRSSVRGGTVGLVSEQVFYQRVVPTIVNRLRLPPTKLLVFWSFNVDLVPPGGNGVILGEHSTGHDRAGTRIWTWVWASWRTLDTVPEAEADVAALSHEIAEWYDNPFGTNHVPPWTMSPYPCNPYLEVGDPLVGTAFLTDGYHLQDEAFLSWFAREVPSTAVGGAYSLFGTLTAVPPVCSLAATAAVPAGTSLPPTALSPP